MGSRAYSLINSIKNEMHRPDFHEMTLHHLVTIFAMLYSYFTNTHPIGVIVLYIHDFGDWTYRVAGIWRDLFPNHCPTISAIFALYSFSFVRCVYQPIWFGLTFYYGVTKNTDVYVHPEFEKMYYNGDVFASCMF